MTVDNANRDLWTYRFWEIEPTPISTLNFLKPGAAIRQTESGSRILGRV